MKIRIGSVLYSSKMQDERISKLCWYGANCNDLLDRICAILIALSPVLQHYIGIYKNAGFTIYLVIMPWLLVRLLLNRGTKKVLRKRVVAIVPIVLYQAYTMFNHGITISKILYAGFMIIFLFAIAMGTVNIGHVFKYALYIGLLASALLILQYICFYILSFHLQLVPTSLLLPESSAWIAGAKTGLINIRGNANGFYRPSAFFLEPSHLAIYFFPLVCILLLSEEMDKWRMKVAIFLSLGIILSTSGIGMVCVACIWLCYFAMYYDKSGNNIGNLKKLLSGRNILLISFLVVVVIALYFSSDIVKNTIDRALFADEGSSAIDGRMRQAMLLVQRMSGDKLLFGITDDASDILFNLPGFFATLYKKGIIGIVLSYWFYGQGVFKLKGAYFWMSIIILILSFFTAHTHGTFYMIFYSIFLIEGYRNNLKKMF